MQSVIHPAPPQSAILLRMQPARLASAVWQSISHFSNIESKVMQNVGNGMQVWIRQNSDLPYHQTTLSSLHL